jgi:hypothetical protein
LSDWIVVSGMQPYDGRYELDLDEAPFTTREWGFIKRHAGYLPIALDADAFTDPELIVVLAIIAIRRSGKIETAEIPALWERFADAPFGSVITLEPGEESSDADSPPSASSNGKRDTSGDSSPTGSVSSGDGPNRTGSPGSATSVSVPQTSAS